MISVHYYGPLRELTGVMEESLESARVQDIIKHARSAYGPKVELMVKKSAIMVNGKNAALLKGLSTRLKSGDCVMIIPLSATG